MSLKRCQREFHPFRCPVSFDLSLKCMTHLLAKSSSMMGMCFNSNSLVTLGGIQSVTSMFLRVESPKETPFSSQTLHRHCTLDGFALPKFEIKMKIVLGWVPETYTPIGSTSRSGKALRYFPGFLPESNKGNSDSCRTQSRKDIAQPNTNRHKLCHDG